MYEAVINYHNLQQIDTEPRHVGTLFNTDIQKLLIKVGGVCVAFDKKNGLKGFSLTVSIREIE